MTTSHPPTWSELGAASRGRKVPPVPTPPGEGSTTAGISQHEPTASKAWAPVALVLIAAVVVLVVVGLVGMVVALA
ncbi:hypothetical protein FNH09_17565 [Streptomyces adustus]|uniref:Uncharacterized protein n=1 Tax=Streptomyces adustus TaxID=1609272 RepID=A0A5N8VEF3_9ACTN|nr:DUF6480 family protein [Streptomyces adustus]MPY33002.1 hypothetical protein [Streptomyces adustus]